MTRRSDQLNDRQGDLLERIADGDDLSSPESAPLRVSAHALQSRGLVTISKRKGFFAASITEVGRYYLRHGYHPENDRPSGWHSQGDSENAEELMSRLGKTSNGTVRVVEPDEKTRAAYRGAVDAARRRGLVPEGQAIRYTGRSEGDIVVRLLDTDEDTDTDWYRIRQQARKSKAENKKIPPQDLRQLLIDNPAALQVSNGQRERAMQFLIDLNVAAAKHDQEVRLTRRGEHAKLGYRIGTEQWELTLAEEHLNSYGRPADYWEIKSSYSKTTPTGKLRLKIGAYQGSTNTHTWQDQKRSPLERRIRSIITDIKASHEEAARKEEDNYRKHRAHMAEANRKRMEERRQWEQITAAARPQAQAMLQRRTMVAALDAWRNAQDLREICTILDDTAAAAEHANDPHSATNLRNWCIVGRELANRLDPTTGPASLANIAFDIEPGVDDLRRYLEGWSPDGPYRDYQRKPVEQLTLSKPWPLDWELGTLP
ncbi:hypothetical protein APR11_004752 [Nocardia amikacinitolerans]|uniref:hypothetical protein n=1 Tax=Nocardia amikacinitolerans TaxID=756689 RepID=UPI0020A468E2|nr:hypothetical protein [Nocardia amikacinitolerans]MCP2298307.1 hypothetical protein [Nocardia amikacinitolerans]